MSHRSVLAPWLFVAALTCACGAADDSAPSAPIPTKRCKSLDDYLAPLDAEVAAGRLAHIGAIVRDDLDRPTLRAFVRLAIDIVRALPKGRLPSIAARLSTPASVSPVVPLLIALLEPLPGDPEATPPVPARSAELRVFSDVATTCLSSELFASLTEVLRDPRLAAALPALLEGGPGLGDDLLAALADAGVKGRTAMVALLRNVAVSIARPDFDPRPLVAMLDGIAAERPTLAALADLLRVVTLDEHGGVNSRHVGAFSSFIGCFADLDPGFVLPGYWYDLFSSGALTMALAATPADGPVAPEVRLAGALAALELLSYGTEVLAVSEPARDALGQFGALILRPDLAVAAIPELIGLLRSGALDGLPAMLSDLATRPCLAAALP